LICYEEIEGSHIQGKTNKTVDGNIGMLDFSS
jgi:hypothetical protein